MNALIGHTGLIGTVLVSGIEFYQTYNSANIDKIQNCEFDTVYCAAPAGNRLLANQRPDWDTSNVKYLADCLRTVTANRFVLISTVDAIHSPESVYGGTRLALEHFVLTHFKCCSVIRLCTLIHPDISKNLLFDIKHRQYLDRVNSATVRQYYPLTRLCKDIDTVIAHNIREINLVSEPVSDQEIIQRFLPTTVLINEPVSPYNLHSEEPFGRYVLTKSQVFEHVREYMDD